MGDVAVGDSQGAIAAATEMASMLGLQVNEALVLHPSNRLAIRLLPSDVLARVATAAHGAAALEVELAAQLARAGSPAGTLDPRVAPRVYDRDGFAITYWTYYAVGPDDLSAADYADGLSRLHAAMRDVRVVTPRFTDRVEEARALVASPVQTPDLSGADRELLAKTFGDSMQTIEARSAPEQLLHGEPHPGNVINTMDGPRFVDLETCCRGPVEFDLAHAPEAVAEHYPDSDAGLLQHCRVLILAMVAAWRLDRADGFPNREQAAAELLAALREGPPYPSLGAITGLQ